MKTTIDLPDEIFQKAKVFCAQNNRTLRDLFSEALSDKLKQEADSKKPEWENLFGVYGKGQERKETKRIAKIISEEFEVVEPDEWV